MTWTPGGRRHTPECPRHNRVANFSFPAIFANGWLANIGATYSTLAPSKDEDIEFCKG